MIDKQLKLHTLTPDDCLDIAYIIDGDQTWLHVDNDTTRQEFIVRDPNVSSHIKISYKKEPTDGRFVYVKSGKSVPINTNSLIDVLEYLK